MGEISRIVKADSAPTPPFNQRLCVELCENVHLHYRNLRLEFSPDEFCLFLKTLSKIDIHEIANFSFTPDAFREIASARLFSNCPHDHRIQLEEQKNGTFHFHYRNLRIESKQPSDIGL